MSRRKIKLTSINGVGAGQTATLDLPTGRRYYAIYARYKSTANQATIEADLTEIRLVVNGKVQRRFSAADLNVINATNGIPFTAGFVKILLAEPRRRTMQGEEGLAWGTLGVQTFRVEFDIAGTATAPTLTAEAEVDDVPAPLGPIMKWYKETFNPTGAQTLNITTLAKRDTYSRIHCRSNLVTAAKLLIDGLEVFDTDRNGAAEWAARRGLVQQANNMSLIFDDSDQVTDGWPMARLIGDTLVPVQELRLDLVCSGAGAVPLLIERVGQPD